MFRDKHICATNHAIKRFIERTGVNINLPRFIAENRIVAAVKRAQYIDPTRIIGLKIEKGTTYAFDPVRDMLFPLESTSRGKRFRVITCLTREDFDIMGLESGEAI